MLKCQQASPGRAVGALADGSLTPMIAVISVGTGVTMPMTATALAREVVGAGKGIQSVLHMIVFPLRKQYLPSGVMDTEGNGLFFFSQFQVQISISLSFKV